MNFSVLPQKSDMVVWPN